MNFEMKLMEALEKNKGKASVYASFTTSSCRTNEIVDPKKEYTVLKSDNKKLNNKNVA